MSESAEEENECPFETVEKNSNEICCIISRFVCSKERVGAMICQTEHPIRADVTACFVYSQHLREENTENQTSSLLVDRNREYSSIVFKLECSDGRICC